MTSARHPADRRGRLPARAEVVGGGGTLIGEATGVPGRVLYAGRTPRIDVSGFSADRITGPAAEKTTASPSTASPGRRGPEANII